ncbi:putative potassium transport system protein kup 1 [Candidatus Propionivibrio aalborgensis]|uniref:Probable potassium transport system protein Kup n=1 Tax=Candidatus Propionivibrio aalborgensis TaxID=1860101 RepID=A0A1A8XF73_9RHOO|nr:potassium transporter Kup [Candidatus Propionivibrio aalborgensis]SBT03839.1 putative potassium transport system protein kup 1 [Candidatus Propionivibrio aalborgensis]
MHQATDLSKPQQAALALAALGVVYGDIGTSPLYTMKEVFAGNHPIPLTPDNILGILSLILWSLIVIVSIKYVVFIMRADNRGEGGIMALIALALHNARGNPRRMRIITVVGLLGAGMFYGDGMVTPAISVLSALEGLQVAAPAFSHVVIPATLLVLFGLFYFQRRGTAAVGVMFGPVMLLWFATLGVLGIYNIAANPGVFRALSPAYGLGFLIENRSLAIVAMGAVVLSVTGAEALYADMGHFGSRPIRQAWFGFVLPSLILNYFGQGALLLAKPAALDNPFYRLAPQWMLYPLVGLATVATVIASQAVISGAFSISRQAMQLGFLPRMEVKFTSEKAQGQVYLPGVNWGLFLAVVILVLGFQSTNNLAAAYGIAVTGDMVITSVLATIIAAKNWGWGWGRAVALFSVFLALELLFLFANVLKIPDGGWFPLAAGALVFLVMITWKRGGQLLTERTSGAAIELDSFIDALLVSMPARVAGNAVFMTSSNERVPNAMLHNLMHNKVLHERVLVVSVKVFDEPYVPEIDRVRICKMKGDFYKVTVQYGFKDEPDIPQALSLCADQGLDIDMMETSFFLGRATLIPRVGSGMALWREKLFIFLFRNAASATGFYKIPSNRVVELGTQVVL